MTKRKKLKNRILLFLAEHVGTILVRILGATWRFRVSGRQYHDERQKGSTRRAIFAFWHCNIMPLAIRYRNQGIRLMISQHSDGEISERITRRFGFTSVRGSTTRGGAKALKELIRIRDDPSLCDVGITPDGPRGPARKAKPGVIFVASKTGIPLVPSGVAIDRKWVLGSWDGFQIPKPFARCTVVTAEEISVPRKFDEETEKDLLRRLQESFDAAEREAISLLERWHE